MRHPSYQDLLTHISDQEVYNNRFNKVLTLKSSNLANSTLGDTLESISRPWRDILIARSFSIDKQQGLKKIGGERMTTLIQQYESSLIGKDTLYREMGIPIPENPYFDKNYNPIPINLGELEAQLFFMTAEGKRYLQTTTLREGFIKRIEEALTNKYSKDRKPS